MAYVRRRTDRRAAPRLTVLKIYLPGETVGRSPINETGPRLVARLHGPPAPVTAPLRLQVVYARVRGVPPAGGKLNVNEAQELRGRAGVVGARTSFNGVPQPDQVAGRNQRPPAEGLQTLPEDVMPTVMSGAMSVVIPRWGLRACVVMAEALLKCRVGCLLNHVYRYGTPSRAPNHALCPPFWGMVPASISPVLAKDENARA